MDKYFYSFREMISLRGLTDHTLKSYCTYIHSYLDYLSNILHKLPEDVTWDESRTYIRWLQKERNLSDRTINHAISQSWFFTMYVLHKPWDDTQLPMRKFNSYLPYVPPVSEVHSFLDTLPTLKQKAMVTLMYSSGLRVGEVCRLKYSDIQRSSMRIHVAQTKNRSDRYALLSQKALDLLTRYWFEYDRPTDWLFPQNKILLNIVRPVSSQRQVMGHRDKLALNPRLNCHSFRHAFATHLYENGADLFTIKELLGHKSLHSTLIYLHLASYTARKITSPFDLMGGDPYQ
ncbi:MAG: tyrosine-type recombinase/integrase [Coprococcus phoceensis]